MPFGRYRGESLTALPFEYLTWLAGLPDLRQPLKDAVLDELEQRHGDTYSMSGFRPEPDVVKLIVKTGQRHLAKVHHPDAGGDLRQMQDINRTCDWLLQKVLA